MLLLLTVMTACKKDDKAASAPELIRKYELAGRYAAQISPVFMGTMPMASGTHELLVEDLGDGRIRLFFDKFQEAPMPFMMSVDINLSVKDGGSNTLTLEGANGSFRADPPEGGSIDPDDMLPGIQLPEGAEGGMASSQASIKGTYSLLEKEGTTAMRFNLTLTPGLPLPIEILIYTKQKLQ